MIELQRVTKYFGRTCAVREVSLSVGAGELLVLVGGSGSGKTTTLKMINRLIEPTSGSVLIDGDDVAQRIGNSKPGGLVCQPGTRTATHLECFPRRPGADSSSAPSHEPLRERWISCTADSARPAGHPGSSQGRPVSRPQ